MLFTSTIIFVFLMCVLSDYRRGRVRRVTLKAISSAPLPQLPLSFGWNWSGIVAFSAIPIFLLGILLYIVCTVRTMWALAVPGLSTCMVSTYYVYSYIRFAISGPSFILHAEGVEFAGHYLRWRDVAKIDYVPTGRTPRIRFHNNDTDATGFNFFDQLYGKTSVSAYFISDPDTLAGWSERLKQQDAISEIRNHGPTANP